MLVLFQWNFQRWGLSTHWMIITISKIRCFSFADVLERPFPKFTHTSWLKFWTDYLYKMHLSSWLNALTAFFCCELSANRHVFVMGCEHVAWTFNPTWLVRVIDVSLWILIGRSVFSPRFVGLLGRASFKIPYQRFSSPKLLSNRRILGTTCGLTVFGILYSCLRALFCDWITKIGNPGSSISKKIATRGTCAPDRILYLFYSSVLSVQPFEQKRG